MSERRRWDKVSMRVVKTRIDEEDVEGPWGVDERYSLDDLDGHRPEVEEQLATGVLGGAHVETRARPRAKCVSFAGRVMRPASLSDIAEHVVASKVVPNSAWASILSRRAALCARKGAV